MLGHFGLLSRDEFVEFPIDSSFERVDSDLVEFERPYDRVLLPYDRWRRVAETSVDHLVAADSAGTASLVVTGPAGALVMGGYAALVHHDGRTQWQIDPFNLFALGFGLTKTPRPDTTTMAGGRIFYSHIDGDGWLSQSLVARYSATFTMCAEVVLREVVEAFPDLPVTVAPVAAELDPEWLGTENAVSVARELFRHPNVEAGTHSYSHTFSWIWFSRYDPRNEPALLDRYFGAESGQGRQAATSASLAARIISRLRGDGTPERLIRQRYDYRNIKKC